MISMRSSRRCSLRACLPHRSIPSDRLVKDPHIAVAREMFVDVEHPKAGKTKLTGAHIKLGVDAPLGSKRPHRFSASTTTKCSAICLGLAADNMAQLRSEGVI